MASYGEQIAAARTAHLVAIRLEAQARKDVEAAFTAWEAGELDAQSIRYRLESIIRSAYRTSAAVAIEFSAKQSGLPNWKPSGSVFRTEYLDSLIRDVRRNLREFKISDRDDAARRRHVLRVQHSAGVAAQRGYTDALIESYAELEALGYQLRKVWMANFVNNTPCPTCRSLHGKSVGLRENFKFKLSDSAKVYMNLQGPPRHPRCQCYLCILVTDLTNVDEVLDVDEPEDAEPNTSMTTDDVKKLPKKVFLAVVNSFRSLKNFFSKKRSR